MTKLRLPATTSFLRIRSRNLHALIPPTSTPNTQENTKNNIHQTHQENLRNPYISPDGTSGRTVNPLSRLIRELSTSKMRWDNSPSVAPSQYMILKYPTAQKKLFLRCERVYPCCIVTCSGINPTNGEIALAVMHYFAVTDENEKNSNTSLAEMLLQIEAMKKDGYEFTKIKVVRNLAESLGGSDANIDADKTYINLITMLKSRGITKFTQDISGSNFLISSNLNIIGQSKAAEIFHMLGLLKTDSVSPKTEPS